MNAKVIDRIRQRYAAWRAAGRSRDGFFRLVCRGFDDVLEACGGRCLQPPPKGDPKRHVLFLDADFSIRSFRDSVPDFASLNQLVSRLGIFAEGSTLHGTDEDEVWYYALALIAEKVLAWLAAGRPANPELLLALGRIKGQLHKTEESDELYGEAMKKWDSQSKRKRMRAKQAAI